MEDGGGIHYDRFFRRHFRIHFSIFSVCRPSFGGGAVVRFAYKHSAFAYQGNGSDIFIGYALFDSFVRPHIFYK
jgi:hypothetical protein